MNQKLCVFSMLNLLCLLCACTQKVDQDDMLMENMLDLGQSAGVEAGATTGGTECDSSNDVQCEEQCDLTRCQEVACQDAPICQTCEDGGNCLFTGSLRLFGTIKSKKGSVISDLSVLATCGESQVEGIPDEQGIYSLMIQVENCEQLTVTVQRAAQTEGYVPLVYRYQMPPSVNTIQLDLKLEEATEIRCDGVKCEARNVVTGSDNQLYRTGYAYNSLELNEISNFGAIFESNDGELLWLHRFIYRDYRNERSETINRLVTPDGIETYLIGFGRLNFETRTWVNDLSMQELYPDYHIQSWSDYADNDDQWNRYYPLLTDPNIDPDGDGFYNTIDMATYKLNLYTGQWELVTDSVGELLCAKIWADLEPVYKNDNSTNIALQLGQEYLVPVPDTYLRQIQTNGIYGPSYNQEEIDEFGMLEARRGYYQKDYTGIPHVGSGIYAMGQAVPRTCWLVQVVDRCDTPILGAQIRVTGVNHGYRFDDISDSDGLACIDVGRSESGDQDFDGDQILNELFDVKLKLSRPLNTITLRAPDSRTESTPTHAGTCLQPESCTPLTLQFENCLDD